MEDKPKLRVINSLKNPPARRFVGCCPEKDVTFLPHDEGLCQWWINSPDHGNCFWRYLRAKSSADGSMRELVQWELAELFAWSTTKTNFMYKQAMIDVFEAFKLHSALDFLEGLTDDEVDTLVNLDFSFDSLESELD